MKYVHKMMILFVASSLHSLNGASAPALPKAPVAPAAATETPPTPPTPPKPSAPAVPKKRIEVDAAHVAQVIRDFKKNRIAGLEKGIERLKSAEKTARQALLEAKAPAAQKAAADAGKPGPYLGALIHWAKANAKLQEQQTTLEYVKNIPENMAMPVTTLTQGVEQARTAMQTIHGLNKTKRDASLRAFKKQQTRKKGQIGFKQADYTAALREARNDLAVYYEVLSKWYAGVPAFFEQCWEESMTQFEHQVTVVRRMQRDLEAQASALGIALGDTKEVDIALAPLRGDEDVPPVTLPLALAQETNEQAVEAVKDKDKSEQEAALEKRWHAINEYLVDLISSLATIRQGDGHIGKREMVEQRKNMWNKSRAMAKEARKEKGSLDNPNHPFRKAQQHEETCRNWYERDAGRLQAEEMVRQTHQQIDRIGRDIRMIDEETPDASEESRRGFAVFNQELTHALSPHFLEGNRIISHVTAGVGKHVANFKQMQPIWQEFENRLNHLRGRFPELDVVISGCRWFVSLNAPGLAVMA